MVIGLSSMLIWMYSKFKELSKGEKKMGLFMIILASEKEKEGGTYSRAWATNFLVNWQVQGSYRVKVLKFAQQFSRPGKSLENKW